MTKRLFAAVLGSAITLGGCGSDTPAAVCAPDTAVDCRCDDGRLGTATCTTDGASFEACACTGSQPPPTTTTSSSTGGQRECRNDLSGIGAADFTIKLKVDTTQQGNVALVNQRDVCNRGMFWDLRIENNTATLETDDGQNYGTATSGVLNDGGLHAVIAKRQGAMMWITIDGAQGASVPSTAVFGALPAIAVGNDVCNATDGTQNYVGELDPCVTSP